MEITTTSSTVAAAAAARMHALLAMRHGATGGVSEPLDCSTPILDLCIRRQPRTPSPPRGKHHHITAFDAKRSETFADDPTSTVGVSVSSTSPGSETSETSISSDLYRDLHARPMQGTITTKVKVPRPFKAYPKDPLSLTTGVTAAECVLGKDSVEAYSEFRRRMLAQVQATHGITNKNMRRTSQTNNNNINNNREDPTYWEKRRKNNEAAKRSRDARRAKEDEIAIRAAFLEQENLKLRYEVAALRNELEKLRSMLYNHPLV